MLVFCAMLFLLALLCTRQELYSALYPFCDWKVYTADLQWTTDTQLC